MEPRIQRWSTKRKVELLLSLNKGERKPLDVCREYDLKQSEVEACMATFMKARAMISATSIALASDPSSRTAS